MPKFGGAPKCHNCETSVYFAEELKALGVVWHKRCFKCSGCSKVLDAGSFSEHDEKPWCRNCYGKRFGPKGVGGGATAGCLETNAGGEAVSKYKNTSKPAKKFNFGTQEKCVHCDKTVYAAEKLLVLNKIYHKTCVKCNSCNKVMPPGSVTEHDDKIYCKHCYNANFAPKGFGYNMSGANMNSYQQ